MQAQSADKQAQLQHQIAVNGQLMRRKEDMEWQLLTALAQVRYLLVCHPAAKCCIRI